ncbi:MAG: M42 family peptidase [Ardenticatenales bacterium]
MSTPQPLDRRPDSLVFDALATFVPAWGPSGREGAVREAIVHWLAAHAPGVQIVRVDALGNLITRVAPAAGAPATDDRAPRLLLAAHMDEIGCIATHVDGAGFVRFNAVGGLPIADLVGTRVRFADGVEGTVGIEASARKAQPAPAPTLDALYIDVGASSREDCPVRVGDAATYGGGLTLLAGGRRAIAHNMDNRAGCAAVAEALRRISLAPGAAEVWGVFTVQEEIGLRGARTVGFGVPADVALAVDITGSGDLPGGPPLALALGQGAAIKICDGGMISHRGVVAWLTELAGRHGIPSQPEVLPGGTTDAAALQVSGAGVPSGAVSIPTRHAHRPGQIIDLGDLEATAALLAAAGVAGAGPLAGTWYTPQD